MNEFIVLSLCAVVFVSFQNATAEIERALHYATSRRFKQAGFALFMALVSLAFGAVAFSYLTDFASMLISVDCFEPTSPKLST